MGKYPLIKGRFYLTALGSVAALMFNDEHCLQGKINYFACTISKERYDYFIELISWVKKDKSVHCYLTQEEHEHDWVMRKEHPLAVVDRVFTPQEALLFESSESFSFNNTCRTTAVHWFETILGLPVKSVNLSKVIFRKLPFSYDLKAPQDYFYVFPQLPESLSAGENQKNLLMIFQRMKALLKKDASGENTIAKFALLKQLYQMHLDIQDNTELLQKVKQLKDENKDTIEHLRAQSTLGKLFVRNSSTKILMNELVRLLEAKQAPALPAPSRFCGRFFKGAPESSMPLGGPAVACGA